MFHASNSHANLGTAPIFEPVGKYESCSHHRRTTETSALFPLAKIAHVVYGEKGLNTAGLKRRKLRLRG
jgi:hypothetical protein